MEAPCLGLSRQFHGIHGNIRRMKGESDLHGASGTKAADLGDGRNLRGVARDSRTCSNFGLGGPS